MPTVKALKDQLAEVLTCGSDDDPSWLTHKAGVFTIRDEFYYTFGKKAQHHANHISKELKAAGIPHAVLACGEIHKGFRGAANIRASSHWWVDIKLDPK